MHGRDRGGVHADSGAGRAALCDHGNQLRTVPERRGGDRWAVGRHKGFAGVAGHVDRAPVPLQPSTPSGTLGTVYEFMFWNVGSRLIPTKTAVFKVPFRYEAPSATAWYLPVCVVVSSCPGGGASAVTTWAFSLTTDNVLPETPIASVMPASAWTSPSKSVSTPTAVDISAASELGPYGLATEGTVFSSWFVFDGASTVTVSGLDLAVPAGESAYAIAFYNQFTPHHKPPYIGAPHCI